MENALREDVRLDARHTQTASHASPKEKFDMLYGMLRETQTWLFDFEFKQATFLVIILGWIVSTDTAQTFFEAHPIMQIGMTGLIVSLVTFHTIWVYMYYVRSKVVHQRLVHLDYIPADYYEPQRIHRSLAISFGVSYFLISVVICLAVWLS